jgi:hypothetical protein
MKPYRKPEAMRSIIFDAKMTKGEYERPGIDGTCVFFPAGRAKLFWIAAQHTWERG